MIQVVSDLPGLRERVRGWKREGLRVGFVPTMGNLHAGHQSLVLLARANADRVVASVFVNPTQFAPGEDFERYPRTPEDDAAALDAAGCDLLWLPSVETMYPFGPDATVQVRVPAVAEALEGAHRPGHFDGVATVVARLFNQVDPDVAVFGRKDYQQLAVVRYMAADLAFPPEILAGETIREADGLALSSRNQYLSPAERAVAPALQRALQRLRDALRGGAARDAAEADAAETLRGAGLEVDYIVARRRDLAEPAPGERGAMVALAAARLGRTRLIDNLEFELH